MYVTTFYSFKGGVGRSMALVNIGLELARRNRRVLLVDFDLEAPALDSFKALRTRAPKKGFVDFVHTYLVERRSDDLENYITECLLDTNDGSLWLMPAGDYRSPGYSKQFLSIDWEDLYMNQQGYLLMEDLKQQWKNKFKADFVLIDVGAGHSDIGAIGTRQLPDAVAIFYFPNAQNLRGLTKVIRAIRMEYDGSRKKAIQLHLVMSNIPDLDDVNKNLEKEINSFKTRLDLSRDPMIVHHYDSLALLNQSIFILDRPTSRLAKEYRIVTDEIVRSSVQDYTNSSPEN